MTLTEVDVIHKQLRKCRYFYYELHESLMSDYDYDMLEKQYTEVCDRLGLNPIYRVDGYVGSSDRIPRSLLSFYKEQDDTKLPECTYKGDEKIGQLSLF